MWTNIFCYLVCTVAICVAVVLTCSGGWWSLAGLCYDFLLFVSGILFPRFWRRCWIVNKKIMSNFK